MKRIKKFIFAGLPLLGAAVLLEGCDQILLFNPKGPIGEAERFVIIAAIALMLIVVIPVAIMNLWFPWRYRADRAGADYAPKWSSSMKIELVVWLVPAIIVTLLGVLVWNSTHRLDPYKPIDTGVQPVRIEAVSLDWKWLFIYPELNIATVNQLVFPAKVPLSFRLTSATVMTSFFIPQLGSQIYAMAGMQTQLNLLANQTGTYRGLNTQFSGEGFASMHFNVNATSAQEFQDWVAQTKTGGSKLDDATFKKLETPDEPAEPVLFSEVRPGLFQSILQKFSGGHEMSASHETHVRLAQAQK